MLLKSLNIFKLNQLELIDRLENAIQEYLPSQINYWRSYGLAHLKVIAGSSEYAASDKSIQDLIDEANSEEEDEDY